MQNQASLNYAEVQPKLNNRVVTAHKKWEKNFASRALLRNFARDKNTPHMMIDQENPTFEWLDENLEPYCPGRPTCQEECNLCPVYINEEACILFKDGKIEEAKELFKAAIELTPDWKHGAAWTNLATVYNRLGYAKDAFESFKNAYCINQDNAKAYEGLAASYAALEEYDKAFEWCDKYAAKFGEEGIAKLRGKILKKL